MQFRLILIATGNDPCLPVNYQYPVSAAIFKILAQADRDYAAFLHNTGYTQDGQLKSFKLFTFSDLKTPFRIQGDRLLMLAPQAELLISFHLPKAAETFIKGLFVQQQMVIADSKSRVSFTVSQVEALNNELNLDAIQELIIKPNSPIVCGIKNQRGHYDFLPPEHPGFVPQLLHNWKEKYKTVFDPAIAEEVFAGVKVALMLYEQPPKSRLVTIKAGTPAETKIRGFMNFRLKLKGQRDALELLLNAGVGAYNSMGMGSVEVEKIKTT